MLRPSLDHRNFSMNWPIDAHTHKRTPAGTIQSISMCQSFICARTCMCDSLTDNTNGKSEVVASAKFFQ